jgi:hypothetical protein
MNQVIGRCSNCGGQVVSWEGPWYSVSPPPPPTCQSCGWVAAWSRPTIPMTPPDGHRYAQPGYKYDWYTVTCDQRRMDQGATSVTDPWSDNLCTKFDSTATTTTEAVRAAMDTNPNVGLNSGFVAGTSPIDYSSIKSKDTW